MLLKKKKICFVVSMSLHDVAAFFWNLFSDCTAGFLTSGVSHGPTHCQEPSMLRDERTDSIDVEDEQEDDLKSRPKLLYMLNTENLKRRNVFSSGANEPSNDSLQVSGILQNHHHSRMLFSVLLTRWLRYRF